MARARVNCAFPRSFPSVHDNPEILPPSQTCRQVVEKSVTEEALRFVETGTTYPGDPVAMPRIGLTLRRLQDQSAGLDLERNVMAESADGACIMKSSGQPSSSSGGKAVVGIQFMNDKELAKSKDAKTPGNQASPATKISQPHQQVLMQPCNEDSEGVSSIQSAADACADIDETISSNSQPRKQIVLEAELKEKPDSGQSISFSSSHQPLSDERRVRSEAIDHISATKGCVLFRRRNRVALAAPGSRDALVARCAKIVKILDEHPVKKDTTPRLLRISRLEALLETAYRHTRIARSAESESKQLEGKKVQENDEFDAYSPNLEMLPRDTQASSVQTVLEFAEFDKKC